MSRLFEKNRRFFKLTEISNGVIVLGMENDTATTCCVSKQKAKCPCMSSCPLKTAMNAVGGKWKVPILCSLYQDGATRYNELKRKIGGITNTALASALKELEETGLVTRTQYPEMPVRVEYCLTPVCEDLLPPLAGLARWGAALDRQTAPRP
jgi:DNA-binding HxlR family transcriptional regulator